MSNRTWVRRVARVIAWASVGGALLQTSCSLAVEDAIVSSFASFLGDYISAILQRFIPAA
jgi:hypothetical protein